MVTSKTTTPRITKPVWERGYFSHSYWKGKKKVGSVRLGPKGEWDGIYRWEAGTHFGEASTLAAAKQAVEQVVAFGASQIGLFEQDAGG
jgi:hypothetical protein